MRHNIEEATMLGIGHPTAVNERSDLVPLNDQQTILSSIFSVEYRRNAAILLAFQFMNMSLNKRMKIWYKMHQGRSHEQNTIAGQDVHTHSIRIWLDRRMKLSVISIDITIF